MDIVYILLLVAAGLLFYQVVLYKDPDKLDNNGQPLRKRK
jgi:hypothetical protein